MARTSVFRSAEARAAYDALYDEALAHAPMQIHESDVETSFGTTHVLTAGEATDPPLVALHGKSMSATSWLPLLPVLAEGHHVTLIDAIGDVNRSVTAKSMSKPVEIVTWLDETLRALSIRRPAMVGASIGSWMATHYASAHPEAVERLALLCPAGIVGRIRASWLVTAVVKTAIRTTPARVEAFVETMAMPSTRPRLHADPWRPIMQEFVQGMLGFRPSLRQPIPAPLDLDRLAAQDLPVLVIIGRDETLHDGPKAAARFRARLPRARVEVLEAANHLVMIDQPEAVSNLLADFLR